MQIEMAQGGEGRQDARLQARDAVVLQEQRLCRREETALTPLKGSFFSLGLPIHPRGGSHTRPSVSLAPLVRSPAAPRGAHLRPGWDSRRDHAQPQSTALHRGAVAAAGGGAAGSARRETRQ